MADDNQVQFELDLDNAAFLEKGLQAQGVIEKLGSADSLKGLIEGLSQTTAILGTIGAVAFSFKEALDLTMEGEQLQRVNEQFSLLTKQAGISAEALKSGLEEASGGLIATNDLLIAANKALVTMGSSAEALPELMELSRKATLVFGGNALDTFNQLSLAIAAGNTRVLKHMGIIVDTNKAYQDFANQQGIAVNALNAAGKSQAILNAVLEQGDKTFGDMNIKTDSATQLMGILKVTVTELSEVFTKAFEKTIGPTVRSALASLVELADTMKTKVTASFGEGSAQSAAKIKLVEQQIHATKQAIVDLQTKSSIIGTILPGLKANAIAAANAKLIALGSQLTVLKEKNDAIAASELLKGQAQGTTAAAAAKIYEDEKIRQEDKIKYEKDLLALDTDNAKAMIKNVQSISDIRKVTDDHDLNAYKAYSQKYMAITHSTYLDDVQKMNEIEKLDQNYKDAQGQRESELLKVRTDAMANYVTNSENAFEGITRAAQQMAQNAQQHMIDFGKQGQEVMANFQTYSTQAFDKIGSAIATGKDVAKATADAMLGFFLNMIATYAGQWGSVLLMVGIATGNPLAIAEGSGLLLLSGVIKGIAGALGASAPAVTDSSASTASGIQTQTLQAQISIADQTGDIAKENQLKQQLLEHERQDAIQSINDKKDITAAEKAQLLEQNAQLYNLKEQELQNTIGIAQASANGRQVRPDGTSSPLDALNSAQNSLTTAQGSLMVSLDQSSVAAVSAANIAASNDTTTNSSNTFNQQLPSKSVTINIAGNYFDTQSTQRTLMDLIRQETDATDFTYNKVGV